MQFSKTRRLRSRGRNKKEWRYATPAAPGPEKALKTEQQLLDTGGNNPSAKDRSKYPRAVHRDGELKLEPPIDRWPIGRALLLYLLPRKEVIQPHLQVRLPCYDFTPVAGPTFADRLPKRGWLRRLRVLLTPVV